MTSTKNTKFANENKPSRRTYGENGSNTMKNLAFKHIHLAFELN